MILWPWRSFLFSRPKWYQQGYLSVQKSFTMASTKNPDKKMLSSCIGVGCRVFWSTSTMLLNSIITGTEGLWLNRYDLFCLKIMQKRNPRILPYRLRFKIIKTVCFFSNVGQKLILENIFRNQAELHLPYHQRMTCPLNNWLHCVICLLRAPCN